MIPFEGEVPANDSHMNHLESIHDQIITNDQNNADQKKATLEHRRIIISNILMPNPTGGYEMQNQCPLDDDINDGHLFSPGGQAIKLPADASDIFMENNISSPAYGSILKFNAENKYWQNYHRNEDIIVSNGFFDPINGRFFQDFTTSITECNDCILEVTSIAQECSNYSCTLESNQYSTEYFDPDAVMNGGFNYEISACNPLWVLWPVTKRAGKELIYDLLCAIKNGDSTFEFEDKFKNKVIFAKNIILADQSYDYVGVLMPKKGNSIELLQTPLLNNNGTPLGFTNSFEISIDHEIRLNFLKLGIEGDTEEETEALSNQCKSILKAAYSYQKCGMISNTIKNCLQYYTIAEKYKLLDYLDPPDKQNLLILANDYRILGLSPGEKWYKGGVEYPTPEPEDAINTCFDNFEDGDYWGEEGISFAKRINNNVIYVDGHHSISTSNHLVMVTNNLIETSFLKSILSCPLNKFLCFDLLCTLNDIPNGSGFFTRYLNGLGAGVRIWNKMAAGDIHVALSEDKTQITGKIDIVAHSFGYAYSKGMIDYLTEKLAPGNTFGNYYIVAAENAVAYTEEEFQSYSPENQDDVVVDLSLFESVFQYGSDFTPNGDKKCEEDGVAPQTRVRGLPNDNSNNIFIPDSEEKIKNFVDAHLMKNYGWIFGILDEDLGYIKPRN